MTRTFAAVARRTGLSLALLFGTTALAAAQTKGGTAIDANVGGPGTFDPAMIATTIELETLNQMYEGLVMMDENYRAKPMIASSVDVAPDGMGYTFKLRKGVKFHNGKELTSADVLATYERYAKISPNAVVLANVGSYEAPDPYTFVIKLKVPSGVFLDILKSPAYPLVIIPAEFKDKPARDPDVNIGTGPFKFGEWQKDSHFIMRRFDGYVADESSPGPDGYAGHKTVYLDAVRYNFVPEANARVAALQAGDADVAPTLPPDLLARFNGRNDIAVEKVFPGCQNIFLLSAGNPPTNNVLIRRAISAAVNAADIADASGQITRENPSILYAESPYYDAAAVKPYYSQNNPAKAKALLAEAGYKGEKIVLQTNSNYSYMRDEMLVLAEQLKAVGMNVEVQVVDWMTNANNMAGRAGGWNVSTSGFCSQPLLGPQQWRNMVYNFANIKGDTELDAAYDKFFASVDVGERRKAWLDAEQSILGKAYFIKVADAGSVFAYSKKLSGIKPWYNIRFWNVTKQ
jgi:peptide/nickel transport system substrate-binding protein